MGENSSHPKGARTALPPTVKEQGPLKNRSPPAEIGLALTLKAAGLAALYFGFFAGADRLHVTPETMASLISGPAPAAR